MSEPSRDDGMSQPAGPAVVRRPALSIVFDPTTLRFEVNGPLDNRPLCVAMLEGARKLMEEFWAGGPGATEPRVVPVSGALPPLRR